MNNRKFVLFSGAVQYLINSEQTAQIKGRDGKGGREVSVSGFHSASEARENGLLRSVASANQWGLLLASLPLYVAIPKTL